MKLKSLRSAALLVLSLAAAGCGDNAAGPVAPGGRGTDLLGLPLPIAGGLLQQDTSTVSATIGPEGGTMSLAGGHSLQFPAGALAGPTTIRATTRPGLLQVELQPHGLVFPDSALPRLTFSLAGGTGLSGLGLAGLDIVYLNDSGLLSEVLPTQVDLPAGTAQARIHHFSTYALATD